MSVPRRRRWLGRVALAVGATLVLGTYWREDRYSCHLCRALKDVRISSFLAWPVRSRERLSKPGPDGPGHGHDWWRYSYAYSNGLGGCLGSGVVCHTDGRYKDQP